MTVREGFNPHPSRRTGATNMHANTTTQDYRFNPHPSRRTGATSHRRRPMKILNLFQSSPVPEDGCNSIAAAAIAVYLASFNPHPSRRTGATMPSSFAWSAIFVSILTRPGGRVQPTTAVVPAPKKGCFNPHPSRRTGATSSENPTTCARQQFQSSPVPEDGCNCRSVRLVRRAHRFQSSPVPEDGCNSARENGRQLQQFQSSPVPEDGCNALQLVLVLPVPRFNPHPSRRTGAT